MIRRVAAEVHDEWKNESPTRTAMSITDEAIERVQRAAAAQRPFFLFVNYMDAHSPYAAPAPFDRKFPGKTSEPTSDVYERMARRSQRGEGPPTAREREHVISQYDGGIAATDHELTRLMDALRRAGHYDDTMIVLWSDHGEAFGDHGFVAHGDSLYDDQVHVLLEVKEPHQQQPKVVDEAMSIVDMFHQIRHVAFNDPVPQPGPIIAESFTDETARALVRDRFKIIERGASVELYDEVSDPANTRNLARDPAFTTIATSMRNDLQTWIAARPRSHVPEGSGPDAETIRSLRSIGYLH